MTHHVFSNCEEVRWSTNHCDDSSAYTCLHVPMELWGHAEEQRETWHLPCVCISVATTGFLCCSFAFCVTASKAVWLRVRNDY